MIFLEQHLPLKETAHLGSIEPQTVKLFTPTGLEKSKVTHTLLTGRPVTGRETFSQTERGTRKVNWRYLSARETLDSRVSLRCVYT